MSTAISPQPQNTSLVTDEHHTSWERDGFFVLNGVVPIEHVTMLRAVAQSCVEKLDTEMDRLGVQRLGINSKGSRYFAHGFDADEAKTSAFIFSDLMAEITRATLGDNVYLFHEQFVVKAAEKGEAFSWHQDSGYLGYAEHKPYLSCWVALDDVSKENGTVYLLPYDRAGTREYVTHSIEAENNDMVGYRGDDPGIPVICPAGSIACFSSTVFHRSGPNTTNTMRRIYLPQYSCEPIVRPDTGEVHMHAVPFIINGERVRDR